jgi:pSer/pThr/pTyr-binding forkhead associated (FHA) protein
VKESRIELTVVKGAAEKRTYAFNRSRIDIGRCSEVRDSRHRLIRANDVAFAEGGDAINQTVSRQHAHIAFDEASGTFRLRDDGSAHGTAVVRAGRTLTVPRGARGMRLQAGDEIVLGDARLRVRLA